MAAFPGDPWRNKEVGISLPDVGRVLAISAVWLDILPLRMYVFPLCCSQMIGFLLLQGGGV